MAYPDNKEDFTPVVSPEFIRDDHINELQTLLETFQDIFGTFPNWGVNGVADIGNMILSTTQIVVVEVRAVSGAGLLLRDNNAALGVFIEHGGNVGIKNSNPAVDLDVNGEINSTYGFFHDRGDPAAVDWNLGDLTEDGAFHTLDMSGVVPAGAKAVCLAVDYTGSAVGARIRIKKEGQANAYNIAKVQTQVANVPFWADLIVICDADRKVEYEITSPQTTAVGITVKGWWK